MSELLQRRIELANKAFRIGASGFTILKTWEMVALQAAEENDETAFCDADDHIEMVKKVYNI